MSESWAPVLAQVVIMIGGLLIAIYTGRKETHLKGLDRQEVWMNRIEAENEDLRERLSSLESSLRIWTEGALLLYRQLLREGLVPAWRPPENGRDKPE